MKNLIKFNDNKKVIRVEANEGVVAIFGIIAIMTGCVISNAKKINADKAVKLKAIEADIRRLKAYGDEQKLTDEMV